MVTNWSRPPMKANIQARPEARNTRSERNPTAEARMARPPISNLEFEISNPDQNSGDFLLRRRRLSNYKWWQNYQTNPCARRASSTFRVQSSKFAENTKRTHLDTGPAFYETKPSPSPQFGVSGSRFKVRLMPPMDADRDNYQTNPPGMDGRFQIPDLRGRHVQPPPPPVLAPPRRCAMSSHFLPNEPIRPQTLGKLNSAVDASTSFVTVAPHFSQLTEETTQNLCPKHRNTYIPGVTKRPMAMAR